MNEAKKNELYGRYENSTHLLGRLGTAAAILLLAFFLYMLLRKNRYDDNHLTQKVKVGA